LSLLLANIWADDTIRSLPRISSPKLKTKKSLPVFQLCMLGAAGMRESRAGMRIFRRPPHVGFRALTGPPAGGIALRIAHLHTAAAHMGFRTMAVAAACWNSSQQCRCVGEKGNWTGYESNSKEVESEQGALPGDGLREEPAHVGYSAEKLKKNR